jgi:hypothetical protein
MQFITYSLGVECRYCHVEGAREKDYKKTKVTARKMMAMMLAINRENFDSRQVVTCNSCHHGISRPVSTRMIAESGPESTLGSIPEAERTAIDFPSPDAVIAKYVNAIGRAPHSPKSRHDGRSNSRLRIRIDLVKCNILDDERCRYPAEPEANQPSL